MLNLGCLRVRGSSELDDIFEDDHVLLDAGVCTFFFHCGNFFDLEVNDTLIEASLVGLHEEVSYCVEVLRMQGCHTFHFCYLVNKII